MNGRAALFSRRVLFVLVAVGVISFLGSIAIMVGGGGADPGARYGGHPGAVSAIGYKAFRRTLERLGRSVVLSSFNSAGRICDGTTVTPRHSLKTAVLLTKPNAVAVTLLFS